MGKRIYFTLCYRLPVVIFITLLTCYHLGGLNPGKSVNQYLLDSWEITDGFPSNEVTSIAQTPDGYLWFATAKGLVRFDGISFSIIQFTKKEEIAPSGTPIPLTLFVDRNGALWIGSSVGLTTYSHQDGVFRTYTTTHGLSGNRVSCIKEDMRGNLWISYMGGYVDRFTKGTFVTFNEDQGLKRGINAIVENHRGNLFFATREKGIYECRDGRFVRYIISGLDNLQIYAMVEDKKGILWIGTNNGLFKVESQNTVRYTTREGLPDNKIITILKDSEQNLWAGTLEGGLVRIKKTGEGEISFEKVSGTDSFQILNLFEDREKSLWISTLDSGVKRLKDGKFTTYSPLEAYHKEIFLSLCRDSSGHTWTGTYTGKLFHCKGNEFLAVSKPPEIAGAGITAIEEDREGNLWIGTNGRGIFRKKGGTFTHYTAKEGLAGSKVNSIYCDRHGNLWISTTNGISIKQYRRDNFVPFARQDDLPGKTVYNVYEDSAHNIWIAAEQGLLMLTPASPSLKAFAGVQGAVFSKRAPWIKYYLKDVSVTSVYEDPDIPEGEDAIYWIATNGAGLKRLSLKDGNITHYTTVQGMVTNVIYRIFEDRDKNFWMTSNSGVLRIGKSELNRFAQGQVENLNCISYGIADGMKSSEFNNEFSRHSALKTEKGELWFVTKTGISIVAPGNIGINKTPPQVVIEQVRFDRQSISSPIESKLYAFKGIRDVEFRFTAPTFLSPKKIKFKYRIEGIDKKWIYLPAGKERIALYEDMKPGTYTFKVSACNAEGIWNPKATAFTFTLEPLFYQTVLFKIVVLILFIGFVCGAIYIYKKRPFDKKTKYKGSSLNETDAQECIRRLKHLMDVEKVYRDEDIKLKSLAEKIRIPPHILSRILNETLNRNFSDYINYYRIEEAKDILLSPEGSNQKITAVAYDVGFKALTVFYKAFKKFAGKTPKQYKKDKSTKY